MQTWFFREIEASAFFWGPKLLNLSIDKLWESDLSKQRELYLFRETSLALFIWLKILIFDNQNSWIYRKFDWKFQYELTTMIHIYRKAKRL